MNMHEEIRKICESSEGNAVTRMESAKALIRATNRIESAKALIHDLTRIVGMDQVEKTIRESSFERLFVMLFNSNKECIGIFDNDAEVKRACEIALTILGSEKKI